MKPLAVIICLLCLSSTPYREPEAMSAPVVAEPKALTLYEAAVAGTDIPADLLQALAMAESDETDSAIGDDGRSLGRFQINETFRDERVRLYGEYDPHNAEQAANVSASILQTHYSRFGDWALALSAYNAGAGYVARRGRRKPYVARVQMMLDRIGSRLDIVATRKGLVK